MFVQWCIKGVWAGPGGLAGDGVDEDADANGITRGGQGIRCNWWRHAGQPAPEDVEDRLRPQALHDHIHRYALAGPRTPFISLTAGSVERDRVASINRLLTAEEVALRFATDWGRRPGYLFHCWVLVGLKPAVEVQAVAEEVRELHTYTRWSDFQLEGEITAKLLVPSHQIERWAYWDIAVDAAAPLRQGPNPRFQPPERVSNLREVLI